jgi:hypothetical protein
MNKSTVDCNTVQLQCASIIHDPQTRHGKHRLGLGAYTAHIRYNSEVRTINGYGYASEGAQMTAYGIVQALQSIAEHLPLKVIVKGSGLVERVTDHMADRLYVNSNDAKTDMDNQQLWKDLALMLKSREGKYSLGFVKNDNKQFKHLRTQAKEYLVSKTIKPYTDEYGIVEEDTLVLTD